MKEGIIPEYPYDSEKVDGMDVSEREIRLMVEDIIRQLEEEQDKEVEYALTGNAMVIVSRSAEENNHNKSQYRVFVSKDYQTSFVIQE